MRGRKDIRIVFHKNLCFCPDCSFSGNHAQVRLHLRVTHRVTDKILKQHTNECCLICKMVFATKKRD